MRSRSDVAIAAAVVVALGGWQVAHAQPEDEGPPGPVGDVGPAGPPGPRGETGPPGPRGADGIDGADGTGGVDVQLTAGAPVACGFRPGLTQTSAAGTTYLCDGVDGVDGPMGDPGLRGLPGVSPTTTILAPGSGDRCPAGGVRVSSASGVSHLCTPPPDAFEVEIQRWNFVVEAGGHRLGTALCPNGARAIGGGVHVHGGFASVAVQASGPMRLLTGWQGLVRNDSSAQRSFYVVALCEREVQITGQFIDAVPTDDAVLDGDEVPPPPAAITPPPAGVGSVCWKRTDPRGIGTIPDSCAAGHELDAGLCYPNCPAGYDGVGPVCWQLCPEGWRSDGVACWIDLYTYGNGCSNSCPPGFVNRGPCLCERSPQHFFVDTEPRGVGTMPICGADEQYDAGLCYRTCLEGYDSVGPICWQQCDGAYPVECGAGCATTSAACADATTNQVVTTIELLLGVLSRNPGRIVDDVIDTYDAYNQPLCPP